MNSSSEVGGNPNVVELTETVSQAKQWGRPTITDVQ